MKFWLVFLWALGLGLPALAGEDPAPLTPAELLARVLTQNPALLAAQEKLAAAQAGQKALEAMLWPMVSVNGQYTAGTSPRMSMPVPDAAPANMSMRPAGLSYHVNLTAMYPLFTGGKIQAQIEAGKRQVEQMEAEYDGLRLELRTQLRQALLAIRWQSARAALFEAEIARQNAELTLAQQKLALGKLPRYVVLRSQSELARLWQELNLTRLEVDSQRTELARLAALPQQRPLPAIAGLSPVVLPSELPALPDLTEAQGLAVERSPRLRMLRAQWAEAETRVLIARANQAPFIYLAGSLDLGGGLALALAAAQQAPEAATSGVAVDVLIALPVFDGWKRDSELERLQHEAGGLLNTYTDARNRLQAEIAREVLEMQALRRNFELSGQLADQFAEEAQIARLRFDGDKAIQLEVLEADDQLRAARLSQLENAYRYENARILFEQGLALDSASAPLRLP